MYPPKHTQTLNFGQQSVSRARKRSRPSQLKDGCASKYRDRAKERRTDSNPDYADEINQMAVVVDMEKSKYLGGDEKHTHLVKGLDLALLRKVRADASAAAVTATANAVDDNLPPAPDSRTHKPQTASCKLQGLASRMVGSVQGEGQSRGAFGTVTSTYYMLEVSTFAPHASVERVPTQMCRAQGADDAGWVESEEGENAARPSANCARLVSGCAWDHTLVAKINRSLARGAERECNGAAWEQSGAVVNKGSVSAPEPESLEDIDMFADD